MSTTLQDIVPYLNSQPLTKSRRMYEWSFPRTPWKPLKITKAAVNEVHQRFLAGAADLEEYIDLLISFLAQSQSVEDVNGFLASVSDALAEGTFSPRASGFATLLKTKCQEFAGDLSPAPKPVIAPTVERDFLEEERDRVAKFKRRDTKAALEHAYQAVVDGKPGARSHLFREVIAFSKAKLKSIFFDRQELAETSDDAAQLIAIKVWEQLGTLKGGVQSFYPWLHRVCFTTRADAANTANAELAGRMSLTVESDEEPGRLEDNPLLRPVRRTSVPRKLPESIRGVDLIICELIREGLTYKAIGKVLVISERAVSQRVARMKLQNVGPHIGVSL